MRIIAGSLKGHVFDTPNGHKTHPMGDKIKGAIFNSLGDIEELTVLDAFAGSGALGFEALSRGAKSVLLIENDIKAQKVISKNIEALDLSGQAKLVKASANAWLSSTLMSSNKDKSVLFDIILLDPPYDKLQLKLLEKLSDLIKPQGVIVISLPPKLEFVLPRPKFSLIKTKNYGDANLYFYHKIS